MSGGRFPSIRIARSCTSKRAASVKRERSTIANKRPYRLRRRPRKALAIFGHGLALIRKATSLFSCVLSVAVAKPQ